MEGCRLAEALVHILAFECRNWRFCSVVLIVGCFFPPLMCHCEVNVGEMAAE